MCLYPRLIRNSKYLPNKKNGGVIPSVLDERLLHVSIGCGKCMECMKKKARDWKCRLLEDIKEHKNGQFITLTFSNESIKKLSIREIEFTDKKTKTKNPIPIILLDGYERDNAIATIATRLFLERWRKIHKKSLRHWLITEIGHKGTQNIHLHGIVFTDHWQDISKIWQYGYVWDGYTEKGKRINYVNGRTIGYATKYFVKRDQQHKTYNPIILCSPGIGRNYTENNINAEKNKFNYHTETKTRDYYRNEQGYKLAMPIYWRNKIYTEEEREALWLHKLDKMERFVNGERISIKNGMQEYWDTLEWHRKRNEQLGFGNDKKNWKREHYEKLTRNILNDTRIKNAKQ